MHTSLLFLPHNKIIVYGRIAEFTEDADTMSYGSHKLQRALVMTSDLFHFCQDNNKTKQNQISSSDSYIGSNYKCILLKEHTNILGTLNENNHLSLWRRNLTIFTWNKLIQQYRTGGTRHKAVSYFLQHIPYIL